MMQRLVCISGLLTAAVLTSCSNPPMAYIPSSDRSMLEAEARLGRDNTGGGTGISVEQMLQRARRGDQPVAAPGAGAEAGQAQTRLLLHFDGDAVQPDDDQRSQIEAFATSHPGNESLTITSRGDGLGAGSQFLGQRRALAVSHALGEGRPNAVIRFDPDMPDGIVVVAAASHEENVQ